jgi:hypothetical protein
LLSAIYVCNISDSVPEFGANMAQVTLGNSSEGFLRKGNRMVNLRKYMNLRGREDLLIHGQKILMDYRILLME